MSEFVFKHGSRQRVYAEFRAATRQRFGLPTLAHRLRLDYEQEPERIEAIAMQLAQHGRLCVYIAPNNRVREVGIPSEPASE